MQNRKTTDQALTVRALLRELFKDDLADGLLDSLASALQAHIMPQNDLIVISLFFIQHVLPHLDAGPGWMLILLRDMCYENPQNGEVRNRVRVKGGYAEIAGWLGMSRPMTIWEWLHGEGKRIFQKACSAYLYAGGRGRKELGFEISERIFDVLIEDVPHQLLELSLIQKEIHAFFNSENRPIHATFSIGFTRLAEDSHANCTIAVTQFAHSIHATCIIAVTPFAYPGHATCIVKSSLTLKPNPLTLKPLTLNPQPSQEPENEAAPATSKSGRMGNMAFWDFDFLMSNNSVNPGSKVNLLKANKKFGRSIASLSAGFVSWLLYAYSPAGSKISDPIGLAVKRLCENVNAGAGGEFNRLAKLSPFALKTLFDTDLAGVDPGESLEAGIYKLNFHDLQDIHKQELYRRLFGDLEDE